MKLILASILLSMSSPQTQKADLKSTQIGWIGEKAIGSHNGTVNLKGGSLELKDKEITGGKFEIDMTTISVLDIKDADDNKQLTGHLKSEDFFGVEKFPTAQFEITSVKATPQSKDGSTHEVSGKLTIKGISNPVKFPAKVSLADGKTTMDAKIKLDRTKWNVRYRSKQFFENLGDKVIYDEFQIDLKLVATK